LVFFVFVFGFSSFFFEQLKRVIVTAEIEREKNKTRDVAVVVQNILFSFEEMPNNKNR